MYKHCCVHQSGYEAVILKFMIASKNVVLILTLRQVINTVKTYSCNVTKIKFFISDYIELLGAFRKNKTKKYLAINQPS